jgi:hypothetical protein
MNREIFPSGGLLLLRQNCTELVCRTSLFRVETANGGRFVKRLEGWQYQDVPEGV